MENRKYGWVPQLPDFRDYKMIGAAPSETFPPSIDLSNLVSEIYDQGQTSACTAHAEVAAQRMIQKKSGVTNIELSRMFLYAVERINDGDLSDDSGSQVRTSVQMAAKYGVCPESSWPFEPGLLYTKPADNCFKEAVQNMVHVYFAIDQNLNDFKKCLSEGFPFIFGFTVYDSFESGPVASNGIVPMPQVNEGQCGGHAVCAVGYNDTTQTFKVLNSWGVGWGDHGYFHIPYAYVTNPDLASDFWTIRTLETVNDTDRKWIAPV